MKLTARRLLRLIEDKLLEQGYIHLADLGNLEILFGKLVYHFVPDSGWGVIAKLWFEIAERVIISEHALLNKQTVKRLAIDAWRQHYIKEHLNLSTE